MIDKFLYKPEEAPTLTGDDKIGRGLTFGARAWMPGINISGCSYDIAYESVTEDHREGIPVRYEGELIGHATIARDGKATITLFEGKALPSLSPEPTHMSLAGFAPSCEKIALESLVDSFKKLLKTEVSE